MRRLLIIFFLLPFYCFAQTVETYVKSGNEKYGQKDYKAAIADFDKAIQLDSKKASVYFFRANAYNELKNNTAAIQDYTKAIELDPAMTDAYYYRANSESNIKDHKNAVADY